MKILFYTDPHAADQTPRSRTESYKEDILRKLEEIVRLANEHQVDFLVNGADTFDRKSPWRVSHRIVREIAAIFKEFEHPHRHLTVIGTHDVPTGQLEKLPQQPLGMLQEAGVITVLEPQHFTNGLIKLPDIKTQEAWNEGHLDYLAAYGRWIVFHPVPARYDLDKNPANYALTSRSMDAVSTGFKGDHGGVRDEEQNPDDPIVTIAHGMIMKPGQTFFSDFTDAHEITKLTVADVVLYGHPHTPDGVYRTDPHGVEFVRPTFVGPGSVSRRDASPYNRTRIPQVALLTFPNIIGEPPKVDLIPLQSARPGSEVFAELIKDEEDENEREARVSAFVTSLKDAQISDDTWSHETLIEEIRASSAEPSVKQMAEEIITELVG